MSMRDKDSVRKGDLGFGSKASRRAMSHTSVSKEKRQARRVSRHAVNRRIVGEILEAADVLQVAHARILVWARIIYLAEKVSRMVEQVPQFLPSWAGDTKIIPDLSAYWREAEYRLE
jgi:hypothetical protein